MQEERVLQFGPYRFNPQTGQLWKDKQEVRLTPKAAAVLRYVVAHSGHVVTKDELFQAVWAETVVSDSALTSCIQEIRQALRDNARKPRYLETIHKRGVRFIAEVQSLASRVQSQEEEANQKAKGKNQKAKSEDSLESSVQSPASNGQSPGSSVQSLESKTPSTPPDDVQTLDPRP